MRCSELEKVAEAYVDGEFEAPERAEIDAHMADCPECRQRISTIEGFHLFLKGNTQTPPAPRQLGMAITAMVTQHTARSNIRPIWLGAGLAAAVTLALTATSLFGPSFTQGRVDADLMSTPIIDAAVSWHRRNLPVEVTGPDVSVLGDWFSRQVDFPVHVPTFRHRTIRAHLLGGRLGHLQNQEAANVVYEVDGSKLSVLMFRTPDELPSVRRNRSTAGRFLILNRGGYNVALVNSNGVTYSFTSSLPQPRFSELVESAAFRNY